MNKQLIFRPFQAHDQDQVYTLILSILESEFKELPPENFLNDVKDVHANYSEEDSCFFVCEYQGKIVGTAAVKRDDDKNALMRRLFVNPHMRGKKIAKRLVDEVKTFCKDRKFKKIIFVGNNIMHSAHAALKKLGFNEDADIFMQGLEIFKLSYKL